MIRLVWVGIVTVLATLFFGLVAIVASLLRVRGSVYFWATQQWSRAIIWASNTPVIVHGMERVDWSQPQVLACNHVSNYDIFALAAVIPAPFHFVAKKELERIPFFGTAWKAAGHISIDRSNRVDAINSLRQAAEKIRTGGGIIIIFPEGTRSRTGELQPFKKGAFVMAREAGVPIIPAVVRGSEAILRPGARRIHPQPIHLLFDDPVSAGEVRAANSEELSTRLRARMVTLLEQPLPEPSLRAG